MVEVDDVHKTYIKGKVEFKALSGVTLTLQKGDFAALAGPSGSGKTTLLNLIGGMDTPTSGAIIIEGRPIQKCSEKQLTKLRRSRMGFIFQSFNLMPTLSVFENIELPLILNKYPRDQRRTKIMKILQEVGLEDKKNNRPSELSGGQQQRVAIARALVADPAIVLADEPTANLDSKSAQDIIRLLKRLNEEKNVTVLFSTHDPQIIKSSRKVFYLRDGCIESIQNQNEMEANR